MVIEKVHGLQATSLSLNDRFTMLSAAAPDRVAVGPRRRASVNSYFNQNMNNNNNRTFAQQMARRLEMEVKRQALRQRLGALRRFGSENNLPGLRRAGSFGSLSQASVKQRVAWRQSNGNLSRWASFENVSQAWRNFRRRGGGNRALRGRFRSMRGRRVGVGLRGAGGAMRAGRGRPRGAGLRGAARGAARGGRARGRGVTRNQAPKPVPSKEELDAQLDRYMSGTRAALDAQIDAYMRAAALAGDH